jgi:serine protease AprX
VALIDTGVVPVDGLRTSGKLYQGADLSLESRDPDLVHLDTNGHGTHMAGIITGRDDAVGANLADPRNFVGVAPEARLVSVKVGAASGAVDVSQLIAAIDWVVQHRRDNGLNIRVLSLSLGTDSVQPYTLDPLMYAAEVAWRRASPWSSRPATRAPPGAASTTPPPTRSCWPLGPPTPLSTADLRDDQVAEFSSRGSGVRNPDLVAPGPVGGQPARPGQPQRHQLPGRGRGWPVLPRQRQLPGRGRGLGGGRAAAPAAPHPHPDQLKALLTASGRSLTGFNALAQGAGSLDLAKAEKTATPAGSQPPGRRHRRTPRRAGHLRGGLRQPPLGPHEPGRDQLGRGQLQRERLDRHHLVGAHVVHRPLHLMTGRAATRGLRRHRLPGRPGSVRGGGGGGAGRWTTRAHPGRRRNLHRSG